MSYQQIITDSDDYTKLYQNYDIKKNETEPILNKYEYTQCLLRKKLDLESVHLL